MQILYTSTGGVQRTLNVGLRQFSPEDDENVQEAVSENRQGRVLTVHGSRTIWTVHIELFDATSLALMKEFRDAIKANKQIEFTDPEGLHPEHYFPVYASRTGDPVPHLIRPHTSCPYWTFEFRVVEY